MSQVHVDTIYDKAGTGRPDFPAGLTASGPVSVGGTLTYQDVTNIDAVGLVTARTGVRITAGGIVVTAGVTTFSGADINIDGTAVGVTSVTWDASQNTLLWKDNSKAVFGDSDDLEIYHSGTDNFITADTQNLILKTTAANKGTYLQSDDHVWITTPASAEVMAKFIKDGSVELNFDNAKRFETSPTGAVVTGILTATSDLKIGTKSAATTGKAIAMAMVFG